MKMTALPTLIAAAVASLFVAGCGGDGSSTASTGGSTTNTPSSANTNTTTGSQTAAVVGVFLDSAVEGLDYVAGTAAPAVTNAGGQFTCRTGDTVSFSVGGLKLGSAPCAAVLTPLNLSGSQDMKSAQVVNRLLALQLLDDDGDPATGIRLAADVKAALAKRTLDFTASAADFNAAMNATLAVLPAKYQARAANEDKRALAAEHFEDTLAAEAGTPVADSITQTNGAGSVKATVTRYQIKADKSFYIPYEGGNAAVKADFPDGFLPSYGSGLAFKGIAANGNLEFYGITDRGPNGDGPNVPAISGSGTAGSKIFPSPRFAPSFGVISVGKGGAILKSSLPIKASATVNTSGLPIPVGSLGNSAEVPVMDGLTYNPASKAVFDANGLDTESIVLDKKRNALWVSDEYGPFIVRIDPATGIIQNRYAPGSGLPEIFAKRRANRGMEGLTLDTATDRLHGFLQSPLTDGNAPYSVTGKSERIERFARFTRWMEFDPTSGTTAKMYAYPLAAADYQDGRTGNAKLGDVVALGNGKFLVIEQGAGPSGKVFNKLMLVDLSGATDISAAGFNPASSDLEKSSMSGSAVNGADWSAVAPIRKTLLLDLNAAGWIPEKAEGLTLVDGQTIALVNDNDFGLKTSVFDGSGAAIAGADVTNCTVDANGAIVTSSATGCTAGNAIRVARGSEAERPARIWIIRFDKALASYSVPAN